MLSKRAVGSVAEPPLNSTLRRVFARTRGARQGPGASPRIRPINININKDPTTKRFSRTEIVSEKLCDDLIAYLAPILRPYKGCTILDVHPGACLWSRKLHEFLRPKCHILMEPDELYTHEFIKPLLDKRNSKYRHCKLPFSNPASWSYIHPYAEALDAVRGPGMRNLPVLSTSTRDYDDHRLRLIDASLLMTGNLARVYPRINPIHIIRREIQAALDNTGLHRNGLVRQLWWFPDTHKNRTAVCPQVLTGRTGGANLTALAANVTQVAGVDPSTASSRESRFATSNHRVRNSQFDAENKRQVSARMHAAGMYLPEGRKLLIRSGNEKREDEMSEDEMNEDEDAVAEIEHVHVEPKNPLIIQHRTIKQVGKAIEVFNKFLHTIRAASADNWSKPVVEDLIKAIEYPQCLPAAIENAAHPHNRSADTATGLAQRKAIYLDTMLRMISLETHVVFLRDQNIDISSLQSRLAELDHEIREKLMKPLSETCTTLLEDQQLQFSSPQNLLYDRRNFEPLLARKSEFWPKLPLALYDFLPSDTDLDVEDIAPRQEVLKLSQELSKLLYLYKGSPLPVALDRIAANAAQDLIPKVPELTDPRRGGRLDPKNVAMRMVGEAVFERLVRAWFEWPFKPDRYELEIASIGDRGMFGGGIGGGEEGKKEEG